MKETFLALAAILAGIVLLAVVGLRLTEPDSVLGSPDYNRFKEAATSTGVLVTNSSTLLTATSADRTYLRVTNLGPNAVFLALDQGKAATQFSGITLSASSSYEITAENLYVGAVYAIAPAGNSSTTVYAR